MRIFARVNSAITWWKIAIPVLTIIVCCSQFHSGNFGRRRRLHAGTGIKALFGALPGAGIVFAYLGFEQADQLAGEIKNPQRNLPRAIIIVDPDRHRHLHPAAGRVHRRDARPACSTPRLRRHRRRATRVALAPFAALAASSGFGLAGGRSCGSTRSSPRSAPALIYKTSTSRVSYGLARNRYFPQIFAKVDSRGIPWVSLIVAFIVGLVFLLPFPSWHSLVGLVTGGERADVRGRAAVPGRVPRPGARTRTGPTGCPAPRCSRRSRSSSPT